MIATLTLKIETEIEAVLGAGQFIEKYGAGQFIQYCWFKMNLCLYQKKKKRKSIKYQNNENNSNFKQR